MSAYQSTSTSGSPFTTRGVYFHDGFDAPPDAYPPLHWNGDAWQRQIDWMHACGVNAVEFATMLEFNRKPSTELERQKIADRLRLLDRVHQAGMQFGYLLTNTVLSTVPEGEEPGGQLGDRAVHLCPRQPGNFERTLENPLYYMETYKEADFFEQFAADWGGCTCGQCGVPEFLKYVRVLAERLETLNPQARIYANTWCISYWAEDPQPKGWKYVFDHEITATQEVIAALPTLPRNTHLGLPCHHLYRALAFTSYGGKEKTPRFPIRADLERLSAAGREVLAWPHFVMDDDAYRPAVWGLVHSETRYIRDMLQALRDAGVQHVVGNLYLPYLQLSNTYAFGRLSADPDAEPRPILEEFARLVAHREDVPALAEVLAWMDNNSYWNEQLPSDARLPAFPSNLTRETASRLAANLRPNPSPELPLPLPAEEWLAALRRSVERMNWAA